LISGEAAVTVHRGTPVAAADALLRAGDAVVVDKGVAAIRTTGGTLFARAGSAVVFTRGAPRIARGDVLVQGKAFNVAMRAASAEISGIARVRQGLTLEVGMYKGGAVVHTATETVGVPLLRRVIVAGNGGVSAATLAPLVLDATDAWDRKFLGDAIELDAALTARSRGLTLLIAGQGNDVLSQVLATPQWHDALTVLGDQPIGEVVVAAELARAAHLDKTAIAEALKLRGEGASWGLIAIGLGVHDVPAKFAGLDAVAAPEVAPAVVVPQAPAAPTPLPAATTPLVTLPTAPVGGNQPPVTVPPSGATATDPNPVASLVHGLGDVIGGLLGR
jgi:hypothetical protein